jgi:hypothetical protein
LGPLEIAGSQFHGTYFAAFTFGTGNVDGKSETIQYLQFQWQTPTNELMVYKYDYEKIKVITGPQYIKPEIKLNFTDATLAGSLDLTQDLKIYNFNDFFKDSVTVSVYMTGEAWSIEKNKLNIH